MRANLPQNQTLHEIAPCRILIDAEGTAISFSQWRKGRQLRVPNIEQIDVIYVRNDGWTLAASNRLSSAAYLTWKDLWVGTWTRQPDDSFSYM